MRGKLPAAPAASCFAGFIGRWRLGISRGALLWCVGAAFLSPAITTAQVSDDAAQASVHTGAAGARSPIPQEAPAEDLHDGSPGTHNPIGAAHAAGSAPGTIHGPSIYFRLGDADLDEAALAIIAEHAQRLKANASLFVTLVGFSDDLGSRAYEVALASRRATVVSESLIGQGVQSRQIRSTGYGYEDPGVLPCVTESCRQGYRRVEFRYQARGGEHARE